MIRKTKIGLLVLVGIAFLVGSSNADSPDVTGITVISLPGGDGVEIQWTAVPPYSSGCWGKIEDPLYAVYLDDELVAHSLTEPEYELNTYGHEIKVTVFFGGDESPGNEISLEPQIVSALQFYELNGDGWSGLGWETTSGYVDYFTMANENYQDSIDFYFTDFVLGFGEAYYLASPTELANDGGNLWLDTAGWRTTMISGASGDFDMITIVPPDDDNYSSAVPAYAGETYAVKTQDGYYGLIQVIEIDESWGEIEIKATFQPIKGLRWVVVSP